MKLIIHLRKINKYKHICMHVCIIDEVQINVWLKHKELLP